MRYNDIYDYIKSEEAAYLMPIEVSAEYEWSMKDHIETVNLYKNSRYKTGNNDDKPFFNIILPILNLHYRATGFDVKDIILFVNDSVNYFKSFLIKKFHEKWAREHQIDTFIDEMVESYVDYGGALIKRTKDAKPEVVPLQSIAFCDQTDLLGGPIGIRHFYSPDQLREKINAGWENIDELIEMADSYKTADNPSRRQNKTPGKYIEVYEVHGTLPTIFLDEETEDKDDYTTQIQIVGYYTDKDNNKQGITLFRKKQSEIPFKAIIRDKIYGRALGRSAAEELFEAQVWINYDMIRRKEMLDEAAKIFYKSTDASFATRNRTSDITTGEILTLAPGTDIAQVDNFPRNDAVFSKAIEEWQRHAQQTGAANESILGESPASGTPFKLQELVTAEAHSLHEYRKGKLATFLDEVYMEWIIPELSKAVTKKQEFLAELDAEELQQIAETLANNQVNKKVKEQILQGQVIFKEEVESLKETLKADFIKGGNKKFVSILEGELKDAPVSVEINIAGKQKDLAGKTDKLVNILRFVFSTYDPNTQSFAIFNDSRMAKLFNDILESSGLSPITYGATPKPQIQAQAKQVPPQIELSAQKPSPIPA